MFESETDSKVEEEQIIQVCWYQNQCILCITVIDIISVWSEYINNVSVHYLR